MKRMFVKFIESITYLVGDISEMVLKYSFEDSDTQEDKEQVLEQINIIRDKIEEIHEMLDELK